MTQVATRAPETSEEYVARLLHALGSRDAFEVLRETADELRRAIQGLSDAQLSAAEGPGLWNIRQVIQHLSDSELVVGFRIRMVLAHDRPVLPGYDQERWAEHLRYERTDVEDALLDFERQRNATLRLLQQTRPEDRARVGIHSERGEESITQMILNQAGHDIVHLRQLARIRRAVGAASE